MPFCRHHSAVGWIILALLVNTSIFLPGNEMNHGLILAEMVPSTDRHWQDQNSAVSAAPMIVAGSRGSVSTV